MQPTLRTSQSGAGGQAHQHAEATQDSQLGWVGLGGTEAAGGQQRVWSGGPGAAGWEKEIVDVNWGPGGKVPLHGSAGDPEPQ